MIYNTERTKIPPTSWNVLWDPAYRNDFTIADLGEHNIYITALALGNQDRDLNSFNTLNTTRFRNKLSRRALWLGVDTADDLKELSLAIS